MTDARAVQLSTPPPGNDLRMVSAVGLRTHSVHSDSFCQSVSHPVAVIIHVLGP